MSVYLQACLAETLVSPSGKAGSRQLDPRPGEQVYVELRNLRVFSDDYQI